MKIYKVVSTGVRRGQKTAEIIVDDGKGNFFTRHTVVDGKTYVYQPMGNTRGGKQYLPDLRNKPAGYVRN